jgi:hypothetical protein
MLLSADYCCYAHESIIDCNAEVVHWYACRRKKKKKKGKQDGWKERRKLKRRIEQREEKIDRQREKK